MTKSEKEDWMYVLEARRMQALQEAEDLADQIEQLCAELEQEE